MAVLLTIQGCSRCEQTKHHLKSIGIPFTEINVIEKPKEAMKYATPSHLIVPVLLNNGKSYSWQEVMQLV
ncbi:glutaredoxin domain-containing protein [Bacillus spongiae]|uniref:Glutaredoxin domain-containing protein n=1 Tax=Bacillus spongiae TaxID=2683610 RepID=A0ABU8HJ61_9BACI